MTTKRFANKRCVLCGTSASSPAGEHIWPKWLLTDQNLLGPGPYTMYINDAPTRKRDGEDGSPGDVRRQSSLMGSRVPMCAGCNAVLNQRFEVPVRAIVRKLLPRSLPHVWPKLAADEAAYLAYWLLKIGVLLKHSEARHDDVDQDNQADRWATVPTALMSWMIDRTEPPEGLSLFLQVRGESLPEPAMLRLPIPTIVIGDKHIEFLSANYGLRGLDFTMIFHPDWPLSFPLMSEGAAAQLWPLQSSIDIGTIIPTHRRSVSPFAGPYVQFASGMFPSTGLPPLSCDLDLFGLVTKGLAISVGL